MAAIETVERFGKRLFVEAWKRGWSQADKKVVMGDGAEWIWNIADQQFPGAVQIVDLFHARQHLWDSARALHPLDQPAQQRWILRHQPKLDSGQIEKLTAYLDSRLADATPAQQEILQVETAYFDKNKDRMRYPEFRAQGLFIGSGVIEAGCKTLIGARLKQSGMFWSVEGANAIIALRCCQMNNRFQDYWDQRRVALTVTSMSRTRRIRLRLLFGGATLLNTPPPPVCQPNQVNCLPLPAAKRRSYPSWIRPNFISTRISVCWRFKDVS